LYVILGSPGSVSIIAINTVALEQAARGLRTLTADDFRVRGLQGDSVDAMALSPDGTGLYVVIEDRLDVVDTQSFTVASKIDFADTPKAIDLTPDGKFAVVLTKGVNTRLHLLDTGTGNDVDSFVIGGDPPVAVVASPDGGRAYAVLSPSVSETVSEITLVVVDLRLKLAEPPISLAGTGLTSSGDRVGITITPQGDRIYLTAGDTQLIAIVPVGVRS